MKLLIVLMLLVMTGCNTTPKCEPTVKTIEVDKPVAVPCIKDTPAPPVYHWATGVYPGDKEAAGVLAADFEAARAYGRAWETATIGCLIDAKASP